MPDPIPAGAGLTLAGAAPDGDAAAIAAARAAASAAGDLAAVAAGPDGLTSPATVHAVAGDLAALALALPLLCRRLSAWVSDEYSAGRLGTGTAARTPAAFAGPAWFHLEAAAGAAAQLGTALSAAAEAAGQLRRPGRDGAR
jgi:hypothetical protein